MRSHCFDCIIVGGGLAGSLLFYALKKQNPSSEILLIEKNSYLGGNHTWCFHESDISWSSSTWIRDLISKSWDGYEVLFPRLERNFNTFYHAIRSQDLNDILMRNYPHDLLLETEITTLNGKSVTLKSGRRLRAHCVIDARGWTEVSKAVGYQKFVGLDLKLKKPHSQKIVRLKDARVEQLDGYRFVYILPWSEDELLIEDTYYSNNAELDIDEVKKRILSYAIKHGYEVDKISRIESGCLPLVSRYSELEGNSLKLGASSGEYQPVTGYTFPQTYRRVEALVALGNFMRKEWREVLEHCQRQDRSQRMYFHFLNKMLFRAADPESRYQVLERFYKLPLPLIERFYQGRLSRADQLRILIGKPPVSIFRAIKSLIGR